MKELINSLNQHILALDKEVYFLRKRVTKLEKKDKKRTSVQAGKKYGYLKALRPGESRIRPDGKGTRTTWVCKCVCGKELTVLTQNLKSRNSASCGCKSRTGPNPRHGHTVGRVKTPTYKCWENMIQRCTNPNRDGYENYGGRGISVCERWMVFDNFLEDMGEKPEGLQIDRIDNDGNYEPDNCHWVTVSENMKNRRSWKSQ